MVETVRIPNEIPDSVLLRTDTVFVTGLATDFCVAWTALDARNAGLNVYVVDDACRGIDINGSVAKAWEDMTKAGVKKIESGDIA